MKQKLTSRKFWICVAAFLASIATSIAGIQSGDKWLATIGTAAGIISAAIYAAAEASVDKARIQGEHPENNVVNAENGIKNIENEKEGA